MRRYIPVLIISILLSAFLIGCDSAGDGNGDAVRLDGPILETIARTGVFEFNGAVINISNEPVSSIFVLIILKDETGETIEVNSVSVLGESEELLLMPSESAFFTITFETDPSTIFSKEVEIYYDEFLLPE